MRLLLDTTYFIPAIGISVKDVPSDLVLKLLDDGYEIWISEVSLFELSAKGAKYVASRVLDHKIVLDGIRAIIHDDRINKASIYEIPILSIALKLRSYLSDFIDCLITSTALIKSDILVTEDKDIKMLYTIEEFKSIVREVNPGFKIESVKEVLRR